MCYTFFGCLCLTSLIVWQNIFLKWMIWKKNKRISLFQRWRKLTHTRMRNWTWSFKDVSAGKSLTVLPEGSGSIPNTYSSWSSITPVLGDPMPSMTSLSMVHRHTCRPNTHTREREITKSLNSTVLTSRVPLHQTADSQVLISWSLAHCDWSGSHPCAC